MQTTTAALLMSVSLSDLCPHPLNPRMVQRDDVVSSIAIQLRAAGEFAAEHAPLVRPIGTEHRRVFDGTGGCLEASGPHEILSGHHRVAAAKLAGLASIPCWVREMSDDEAHMMLVLCNAQGELSPLELGMHALHAFPVENDEKGGRGKKGGISAYAKAVGKSQPHVAQLRAAAEVASSVVADEDDAGDKPIAQAIGFYPLLDKAKHLSEIHSAAPVLWPTLARHMLAKKWTVADTKHYVEKAAAFSVPAAWEEVFLPLAGVVDRFLDKDEFAPITVANLCAAADRIRERIEAAWQNPEARFKQLTSWLTEGVGGYAWDVRQLLKYEQELEAEISNTADQIAERWCCGNWRDHLPSLPDGSVSLVLTDPPYGISFKSDRRTDRRQERRHDHLRGDGDGAIDEIAAAMAALAPKLRADAHVLCFAHWSNEQEVRTALESAGLKVRGALVWVKNQPGMGDPKTTFAPKYEHIIHAVKGSPILFEREADVLVYDKVLSDEHPTEKPVELLARLIEVTTAEGCLVVDPFGGVASTLVAAKQNGRDYWGCEINENYHTAGKVRLSE